jgi:hypothetical protein
MVNWKRALGLSVALASGASISSALAQEQLSSQQVQMIRDTAASICNTIKEAKGQRSDVQLEGDVKAQLGGLVGKFVDVAGSGKGSLSREEFEGLSRDATAAALEGDRGCRERVFDKMFDKLTSSDKRSEMTKGEKLIAMADLGYDFEHSVHELKLDSSKEAEQKCSKALERVNSDTARLQIAPYGYSDLAYDPRFQLGGCYMALQEYLMDRIKEADALEAFEIGSEVAQLEKERPNFLAFEGLRLNLIHHLRSLNLGDIVNHIPNSSSKWSSSDFMASLHGLIRRNYPTVYLSR